MTIHIEDLLFDTIIGILDFERIQMQKVSIDIEINYLYEEKYFINYADVVSLVQNTMQEQKFLLLEDALLYFQALLPQKYPQILSLFMKISKPNIIPNAKVSLSQKWTF